MPAVSARAPAAPLLRDVSLTDTDVTGLPQPLPLLRRCAVAEDALKSIAGGSDTASPPPPEDEVRPPPPPVLESPAVVRGDRPPRSAEDLPSRGGGAGGDERPAADWFGLQAK